MKCARCGNKTKRAQIKTVFDRKLGYAVSICRECEDKYYGSGAETVDLKAEKRKNKKPGKGIYILACVFGFLCLCVLNIFLISFFNVKAGWIINCLFLIWMPRRMVEKYRKQLEEYEKTEKPDEYNNTENDK